MKKITIVTSDNCIHCTNGKKLLQKHGVSFSEVDARQVPSLSSRGVPVLVIEEAGKPPQHILGFDPKRWLAAVK